MKNNNPNYADLTIYTSKDGKRQMQRIGNYSNIEKATIAANDKGLKFQQTDEVYDCSTIVFAEINEYRNGEWHNSIYLTAVEILHVGSEKTANVASSLKDASYTPLVS